MRAFQYEQKYYDLYTEISDQVQRYVMAITMTMVEDAFQNPIIDRNGNPTRHKIMSNVAKRISDTLDLDLGGEVIRQNLNRDKSNPTRGLPRHFEIYLRFINHAGNYSPRITVIELEKWVSKNLERISGFARGNPSTITKIQSSNRLYIHDPVLGKSIHVSDAYAPNVNTLDSRGLPNKEGSLEKLVLHHRLVWLQGQSGSGKTSLAFQLIYDWSETNNHSIPIYISLLGTPEVSLSKLLAQRIAIQETDFKPKNNQPILKKERLLIILDHIESIPESRSSSFLNELSEVLSLNDDHRALIISRFSPNKVWTGAIPIMLTAMPALDEDRILRIASHYFGPEKSEIIRRIFIKSEIWCEGIAMFHLLHYLGLFKAASRDDFANQVEQITGRSAQAMREIFEIQWITFIRKHHQSVLSSELHHDHVVEVLRKIAGLFADKKSDELPRGLIIDEALRPFVRDAELLGTATLCSQILDALIEGEILVDHRRNVRFKQTSVFQYFAAANMVIDQKLSTEELAIHFVDAERLQIPVIIASGILPNPEGFIDDILAYPSLLRHFGSLIKYRKKLTSSRLVLRSFCLVRKMIFPFGEEFPEPSPTRLALATYCIRQHTRITPETESKVIGELSRIVAFYSIAPRRAIRAIFDVFWFGGRAKLTDPLGFHCGYFEFGESALKSLAHMNRHHARNALVENITKILNQPLVPLFALADIQSTLKDCEIADDQDRSEILDRLFWHLEHATYSKSITLLLKIIGTLTPFKIGSAHRALLLTHSVSRSRKISSSAIEILKNSSVEDSPTVNDVGARMARSKKRSWFQRKFIETGKARLSHETWGSIFGSAAAIAYILGILLPIIQFGAEKLNSFTTEDSKSIKKVLPKLHERLPEGESHFFHP